MKGAIIGISPREKIGNEKIRDRPKVSNITERITQLK